MGAGCAIYCSKQVRVCQDASLFDNHGAGTVFELADTGWHPTGLLRRSSETAFYVTNTPVTAARATLLHGPVRWLPEAI